MLLAWHRRGRQARGSQVGLRPVGHALYLKGSGYNEGFIFPWTVSDFGLMDAIESASSRSPASPSTTTPPASRSPTCTCGTTSAESCRRRSSPTTPTRAVGRSRRRSRVRCAACTAATAAASTTGRRSSPRTASRWPTRPRGASRRASSRVRHCLIGDPRTTSARVRVRAGAAHHAEVDRQQPRHRRGHEPRRDRRGHQAARRLRAALRQAVRGQGRRSASPARSPSRACRRTGRSRSPVGRESRRRTGRADGGVETRPAPTSSRRSSTTSPRPASRTAAATSASSFDTIEPYAGDVHPGRRRAGRRDDVDETPHAGRRLDRPAVRHGRRPRSSRTRPGRPSRPTTSTCCACSASPSTRTCSAPPTRRRGHRRRLRQRRRRAQARPGAGAAGAHERRPGDGRGAQEDRCRQPVHRVRRARHRDPPEPSRRRRAIVVELHGVDVYDPTTGEVRSRDTDQIALWMIDTRLQRARRFFVRHCYFTGGQDPYKRAQARPEGRDRRGRLGEPVPNESRARSPARPPARSPSRSSTTTATKSSKSSTCCPNRAEKRFLA